VNDLEIDAKLEKLASEALHRMDGNQENATTLLVRYIEAGQIPGLADRALRDYVAGVIADRAAASR